MLTGVMQAHLRGVSVGPPVWTTIFNQVLAGTSIGWSGYNNRQIINQSILTPTGPTTKVRVTLQAGTTAGMIIGAASIGHQAASGNLYDFDGSQVALLFSGSAGCTVAPGASVVSDPATFVVGSTKNLIIAVYFSGASNIAQALLANTHDFYKLTANEVMTSVGSGYTDGGATLTMVSEIDVS